MITFTSNLGDPAAGDWDGIIFDECTIDRETLLDHCLIEYGGENGKGNVYCRYASPTITNCTIRDSSTYGVYSTGDGFTEFSNNTITSNALHPLSVDGEYVRTLGSGNTLTGNTNEGIRVAGHRIYTTGIWLNQGVPYIIATDLDIGGDSYPEITIEPGNALKFEPSRGIRVGYSSYGYGALLAEGTADSMITFTTNFPYPAPGKWDGITFSKYTLDAVAILDHCLIEYGGGNGKGNIYCYYASPTITNCTITNSSHWGIYLDHSNPTMADNEFADNVDGDIGP
jgi:parallel beta-helix repeat protein